MNKCWPIRNEIVFSESQQELVNRIQEKEAESGLLLIQFLDGGGSTITGLPRVFSELIWRAS